MVHEESTNTIAFLPIFLSKLDVATKDGKKEVKMRGIGHGAIGQMSKAFIIAKGKLSEKGISTTVDMYFKDIASKRDGEDNITAIEYLIKFD